MTEGVLALPQLEINMRAGALVADLTAALNNEMDKQSMLDTQSRTHLRSSPPTCEVLCSEFE